MNSVTSTCPLVPPPMTFMAGTALVTISLPESLVALDIETGELIWYFQMVHHGLWDYDNPAAPNLIDISLDGRPDKIKAVAQVTKQGFTYVFDRVTGEPVWPIDERPVPPATMPGEVASPTQPVPTKPPAFEFQGVTMDDLVDFTPEIRALAVEAVKGFTLGIALRAAGVDRRGRAPRHDSTTRHGRRRQLGGRRG